MKRIRRTAVVPGHEKASDQWRTPPDLFAALHDEFGFAIDLAADAENHLLPNWFGPGSPVPDALIEPWHEHLGPGFLNPPYSTVMIKRFIEKAALEATLGYTTVCLVPHDPSTGWWRWTRSAIEIRDIEHRDPPKGRVSSGRVPYLKADGVTRAGAMFASCIVVFRPQPGLVRGQPRRVVWTWKPEVKR